MSVSILKHTEYLIQNLNAESLVIHRDRMWLYIKFIFFGVRMIMYYNVDITTRFCRYVEKISEKKSINT